jgi:amino acid permease
MVPDPKSSRVKSASAYNGTSTVPISIFNLSKTIVGNGMLSLPSAIAAFADDKIAAWYATLLIVALAAVASYSFQSIGHACAANDAGTFATTWRKCTNKVSAGAVASIVTASTFLSCLASSIILGKRKYNANPHTLVTLNAVQVILVPVYLDFMEFLCSRIDNR